MPPLVPLADALKALKDSGTGLEASLTATCTRSHVHLPLSRLRACDALGDEWHTCTARLPLHEGLVNQQRPYAQAVSRLELLHYVCTDDTATMVAIAFGTKAACPSVSSELRFPVTHIFRPGQCSTEQGALLYNKSPFGMTDEAELIREFRFARYSKRQDMLDEIAFSGPEDTAHVTDAVSNSALLHSTHFRHKMPLTRKNLMEVARQEEADIIERRREHRVHTEQLEFTLYVRRPQGAQPPKSAYIDILFGVVLTDIQIRRREPM